MVEIKTNNSTNKIQQCYDNGLISNRSLIELKKIIHVDARETLFNLLIVGVRNGKKVKPFLSPTQLKNTVAQMLTNNVKLYDGIKASQFIAVANNRNKEMQSLGMNLKEYSKYIGISYSHLKRLQSVLNTGNRNHYKEAIDRDIEMKSLGMNLKEYAKFIGVRYSKLFRKQKVIKLPKYITNDIEADIISIPDALQYLTVQKLFREKIYNKSYHLTLASGDFKTQIKKESIKSYK
ncbi:hypothetical protein [Lacinutrix cladophorae]